MATVNKQQVVNLDITPSVTQDNTLIATWDYPKSTTGDLKYFKDFKIVWYYSYRDGNITVTKTDEHNKNAHSTDRTQNQDEFSIPSFDYTKVKTIKVWVEVTPECEKKDVKQTNTKGKETTKQKDAWNAKKATSKKHTVKLVSMNTPQVPPVPSVEKVTANQKQFRLKASVLNYTYTQNYAKSITLQSRRNRDNALLTNHVINLKDGAASYTSGIMKDGVIYQFRAKGWSEKHGKDVDSQWSEWSDPIIGKPKVPTGKFYVQKSHDRIENNKNVPNVNVVIEDTANNYDLVDGYVIWYSSNIDDLFYQRSDRQMVEFTKDNRDKGDFEKRGKDHRIYARCYLGSEFDGYVQGHAGSIWFYVQAKYGETYSDYIEDRSYYYEFKAGSKPLMPTTWTRKSSFVEDESIDIYWTNNSTDGSFQSRAQIVFTVGDHKCKPIDIVDTTEIGQTQEKTYSISFPNLGAFLQKVYPDADTSITASGAYDIQYQIRTMGAYTGTVAKPADGWSDYSPNKLFQVYRQPELIFEPVSERGWIWDPFDFRYDTIYTAYDGSPFAPAPDHVVDHFPIFIGVVSGPEPQKGIEYSFQIKALQEYDTLDYMGETVHVSVGEIIYSKTSPPTKKYYDNDTGNYCLIRINAWDISLENGVDYELTVVATMNSGLTATLVQPFHTQFADADFFPTANVILDEDKYSAYIIPTLDMDAEFAPDRNILQLSDVVFHIFRRNYDGTMTEIANGLNGDAEISVIDPHPALNGASYRIVGMSKLTGEIVYNDIPGNEFEEKAIIIQWDDEYKPYDILDGYIDETEDPDDLLLYGNGVQGNMLKLPYNIDASNGYDMDKELVNYIGREHPVSYYGTQKGETLDLNTVIPKTSKEIIYALRRLSIYPGDCYIREPNGTGFWANVTASFNINHLEVTVPISIKATRVEGGI